MSFNRRLLALAFTTLLATVLTACATPNREGGATLASQGQTTADALRIESDGAASEFQKIQGQFVISTIMDLCDTRAAADCVRLARSKQMKATLSEGSAQVRPVVELLRLRSKVFAKLRSVYDAFAQEAAYDAKGELSKAVGEFAESAGSFAGAAASALGADPLSASALSAAKALAQFIAEAKANADQIERLRDDNAATLLALKALSAALKAEQKYEATARGMVMISSAELDVQLRRAGFGSYPARLNARLPAGDTIPESADADIRANPGLREGIDLDEELDSYDAFRIADQNYTATLGSIDALVSAHESYNAENAFDLAQFALVENELALAIGRWSDLKMKETAAHIAAKPENAEKPTKTHK